MRLLRPRKHRQVLSLICASGCLFQLVGCEFGEITTTTTLNGRDLVISLIRGAILTPIDQYITDAVDEFFDEED